MAKQKKIKIEDPKVTRAKHGMSQSEFWSIFGVTQSGGSRHESGRRIPRPVRMLMALESGQASIDQLRSGELAERV